MATDIARPGGTPFLERMPIASREQVLFNSSRIRYAAGTIAFQPGDSVRRAARSDPRRTRPCVNDRRHQPGTLPWRASPAVLVAQGAPVLGNPLNRNRAVPLTYDQFRFGFANAVSEKEAKELYETYAVPASGAPLFQAAAANLNPWTEAKVDTLNPERGPLLIISGEKDHTVPWAIADASYKKEKRNEGVTEIIELPNRGHSLVIDGGSRGRRYGSRLHPAIRK